jgi:hypothetical protein
VFRLGIRPADFLLASADPAIRAALRLRARGTNQALMLATNDFYAWAAVLMVASIAVVWLINRPTSPVKAVAH